MVRYVRTLLGFNELFRGFVCTYRTIFEGDAVARPKLGEGDTQRLHVKISDEELEAIDDWSFANRVDSRSEAVRRLMKMALSVDAARSQFSDTMVARGEAESVVFEIAMARVWNSIKSGSDQHKTAELLASIERYQAADQAFQGTLRAMFDELNFIKLSNNPFADGKQRPDEKAKVLSALAEVLEGKEQENNA